MQCEFRTRPSAPWEPCRGFNRGNPQAPDRDVGVWQIETDQLVLQRTRFSAEGRDEGRFTLHARLA